MVSSGLLKTRYHKDSPMKIWYALILITVCLIIALGCSGEDAKTDTQTGTPLVTETPEPTPTATPSSPLEEKAGGLLIMQIDLRRQQMANPSAERLEKMESMGMNTNPIDIQQVFIHFEHKPNTSQVEELGSLGITLSLDSWIPPAGNYPDGYLQARMPVESLENLVAKDYVTRVNTAEEQSFPQGGNLPGGGGGEVLDGITLAPQ